MLRRPRRISNDDNSPNGLPEEQVDSENTALNIDPSALAENCLRELVGRASFGNIRSVIKPVFKYVKSPFSKFGFHQLLITFLIGIWIYMSFGFPTTLPFIHSV